MGNLRQSLIITALAATAILMPALSAVAGEAHQLAYSDHDYAFRSDTDPHHRRDDYRSAGHKGKKSKSQRYRHDTGYRRGPHAYPWHYRGSPRRHCHPVHKYRYDHYGQRVRIGGTMCYDAYGRAFVAPGSRFVFDRHRPHPYRH